jgi:hypothetical protein
MNRLEAYKIFLYGSFEIQMNANDFFYYASAHSVSIYIGDFNWVLEHIEKWGNSGLDSCLAYIQNQEPIEPHRTDEFNKAIQELIVTKQEVYGDVDWDFHNYNDEGPYRKINKGIEEINKLPYICDEKVIKSSPQLLCECMKENCWHQKLRKLIKNFREFQPIKLKWYQKLISVFKNRSL